MCIPGAYGQGQSSVPKPAASSLGFRFDKAQRLASSTVGGGTPSGHGAHLTGLQSILPAATPAAVSGLHTILGGLGAIRS